MIDNGEDHHDRPRVHTLTTADLVQRHFARAPERHTPADANFGAALLWALAERCPSAD